MVKGDQKMMLKRVLVTAFACLFVMAFGLGQVAYGADGPYEGKIKITGKVFDWDTKADNCKIKLKDELAELEVNATGTGDLEAYFVTVEDGNFTCGGAMGDQGFFLQCNNEGTTGDNSTTTIYTYGKVKETKKGNLKFKGKTLIDVYDSIARVWIGVGHGEMTGKFVPVVLGP